MPVILGLMLLLGSAVGGHVAYADTPDAVTQPSASDQTLIMESPGGMRPSEDGGFMLLQARATAPRTPGALSGENGWLIAGLVGASVPMAMFALPFIWAAWAGPLALPLFAVAMLWAPLATGGGATLAWILERAFSDSRSGFFLPVLTSAGVGLLGTAASATMATLATVPFFLVALYQSGGRISDVRGGLTPQTAANPQFWMSNLTNPLPWLGVLSAFVIWSGGLITTAIAGPMTAAWIYRSRATPTVEPTETYVPPPQGESTQPIPPM